MLKAESLSLLLPFTFPLSAFSFILIFVWGQKELNMSQLIKPYGNVEEGKKEQVASMFNNIAGKYDFLNHFLSAGVDAWWRKKAVNELQDANPEMILDVATGTGDLALEAMRLKPRKIIGVDISEGMLEIARRKISSRGLEQVFEVQLGDSEQLPFPADSFDAVMVAFGVRNFEDLGKGLADMRRVLKPNGKLVVLEFSHPKKFPVKQLYRFYSFRILPFWGRLFSRDRRAYTYLPESVAAFPDGREFTSIMEKAGYKETKHRSLTFGICSIYTGIK